MRCLTIVSVVAALASTCAAPSRAQENRATPSIAESGLKGLVRVRARSTAKRRCCPRMPRCIFPATIRISSP